VWSENAALTVLAPPVIVTPPASRTVKAGSPVTFSVTATGTKPLTYAWLHNGDPIPNATSSSYTFTPALPTDAGEYSVRVMNSAATVTSSAAQLSVLFVPQVTIDGGNVTTLQGSNLTLSATAQGTEPLTYQWKFRGRAIPGATGPQLALNAVSKSAAGTYTVEVRNAAGIARSAPIKLTVIIPPTITIQPKPLAVQSGRRAVFRVAATGTKPLLYQWLKDGMPLTNAIKRSFVILQVQPSDGASYSVRISNVGANTESIPVTLSVFE
jgi:hypothetical protein